VPFQEDEIGMTEVWLKGWIGWLMWRYEVHKRLKDTEGAEHILKTADYYTKLLAEKIGHWE